MRNYSSLRLVISLTIVYVLSNVNLKDEISKLASIYKVYIDQEREIHWWVGIEQDY